MHNGLCAGGAVYRQEVGLVLQSSTDVALTERASEACFRMTIQEKAHQVRGTRTSRCLGVCYCLHSPFISTSPYYVQIHSSRHMYTIAFRKEFELSRQYFTEGTQLGAKALNLMISSTTIQIARFAMSINAHCQASFSA